MKSIEDIIDQGKDRLIELTRSLIEFNTTSPRPEDETACQRYVADRLIVCECVSEPKLSNKTDCLSHIHFLVFIH
jgi:acetylornithine deacetylase/succinyl-diaminopimelate desuccinylase-like protein